MIYGLKLNFKNGSCFLLKGKNSLVDSSKTESGYKMNLMKILIRYLHLNMDVIATAI